MSYYRVLIGGLFGAFGVVVAVFCVGDLVLRLFCI